MVSLKIIVILVSVLFKFGLPDELAIKFYNIKCDLNEKYITGGCYLKAVSRHVTALNMNLKFLKELPTLFSHVELFRKYSEFRPYLLNLTVDNCNQFKDGSSFLKNIFINILKKHSNLIEKGCPYMGDYYLSNFTVNVDWLNKFPLPDGKYRLATNLYASDFFVDWIANLVEYVDIYRYKKRH